MKAPKSPKKEKKKEEVEVGFPFFFLYLFLLKNPFSRPLLLLPRNLPRKRPSLLRRLLRL